MIMIYGRQLLEARDKKGFSQVLLFDVVLGSSFLLLMISGGLFRQSSFNFDHQRRLFRHVQSTTCCGLAVIFSFALNVPREIHSSITASGTVRSGLTARVDSIEPLCDREEFFHKPGTDLALILQKRIRAAVDRHFSHEVFIASPSIEFNLATP